MANVSTRSAATGAASTSGTLGRPSDTVFDRWLRTARNGLFGVLFTMAKDTGHHTRWSMFGMIFDFCQLLAYPLYAGKAFPWAKMTNMAWLLQVLTYLNPSYAADAVSPALKVALLFIACAWTAATVLTVIWAAYSFSVGTFATVAPLKFLRATARLTATALFVPFATILISAYKCAPGKAWSSTQWACYGTEHSLIMALVSLLLPCFWAFTVCVATVFFDREYLSPNITARAHGRVALLMITIKTVLTLVFTVASDADPWVLHLLVLASGVLWLHLFLRYLPFYRQSTNRVWTAFAAIFTWAAVCSILARLLDDPKAGVAGFVFYIGSPAAAYAGYALAYQRYERIGAAVEAALTTTGRLGTTGLGGSTAATPFDVELQARYVLRRLMDAAHNVGRSRTAKVVSSHDRAAAAVGRARLAPVDGGSGDGGAGHTYGLPQLADGDDDDAHERRHRRDSAEARPLRAHDVERDRQRERSPARSRRAWQESDDGGRRSRSPARADGDGKRHRDSSEGAAPARERSRSRRGASADSGDRSDRRAPRDARAHAPAPSSRRAPSRRDVPGSDAAIGSGRSAGGGIIAGIVSRLPSLSAVGWAPFSAALAEQPASQRGYMPVSAHVRHADGDGEPGRRSHSHSRSPAGSRSGSRSPADGRSRSRSRSPAGSTGKRGGDAAVSDGGGGDDSEVERRTRSRSRRRDGGGGDRGHGEGGSRGAARDRHDHHAASRRHSASVASERSGAAQTTSTTASSLGHAAHTGLGAGAGATHLGGTGQHTIDLGMTDDEIAEAITLAAELYAEAASTTFAGSALLHLFYANFIRCYIGDRDAEMAVITAGLGMSPSVDIRFLLFQAKRQLEEGITGGAALAALLSRDATAFAIATGGHGHGNAAGQGHAHGGSKRAGPAGHAPGAKLTIIERVQYEQFISESVEEGLRARSEELAFWSELRSPMPSLSRLHGHSEAMNSAINAATRAFERLLDIRSDSVEVLQSYAVFLLEVKRETAAANRYFDKADELLRVEEAPQLHPASTGDGGDTVVRAESPALLILDAPASPLPPLPAPPSAGAPSRSGSHSRSRSPARGDSGKAGDSGTLAHGSDSGSILSAPSRGRSMARAADAWAASHLSADGRRSPVRVPSVARSTTPPYLPSGMVSVGGVSVGGMTRTARTMASQNSGLSGAGSVGALPPVHRSISRTDSRAADGSVRSMASGGHALRPQLSVGGGGHSVIVPLAPFSAAGRASGGSGPSASGDGDDPLIRNKNRRSSSAVAAYAAVVSRARRISGGGIAASGSMTSHASAGGASATSPQSGAAPSVGSRPGGATRSLSPAPSGGGSNGSFARAAISPGAPSIISPTSAGSVLSADSATSAAHRFWLGRTGSAASDVSDAKSVGANATRRASRGLSHVDSRTSSRTDAALIPVSAGAGADRRTPSPSPVVPLRAAAPGTPVVAVGAAAVLASGARDASPRRRAQAAPAAGGALAPIRKPAAAGADIAAFVGTMPTPAPGSGGSAAVGSPIGSRSPPAVAGGGAASPQARMKKRATFRVDNDTRDGGGGSRDGWGEGAGSPHRAAQPMSRIVSFRLPPNIVRQMGLTEAAGGSPMAEARALPRAASMRRAGDAGAIPGHHSARGGDSYVVSVATSTTAATSSRGSGLNGGWSSGVPLGRIGAGDFVIATARNGLAATSSDTLDHLPGDSSGQHATTSTMASGRGSGGTSSRERDGDGGGSSGGPIGAITAEEELLVRREEERTARLLRASSQARLTAKRRRNDTSEAAATSLRMAINAKSRTMEPSLVLLTRVLLVTLGVAVVLDIVGAALQRRLVGDYVTVAESMALSVSRSVAVERGVRDVHTLVRMSEGTIPYIAADVNVTIDSLASTASALDAAHRKLYLGVSTGGFVLADELTLYSRNVLQVVDVTFPGPGSVDGSGQPTPPVLTPRTISLANLGLDFAAKLTQLSLQPLRNFTMVQPSVAFILLNGPGIVRSAMNTSTAYLADRLQMHQRYITYVDAILVIASAGIFIIIAVVVLLPTVHLVKRHTDDVFSIFLHLPDPVVMQMQAACRTQLAQLKLLTEDGRLHATAMDINAGAEEAADAVMTRLTALVTEDAAGATLHHDAAEADDEGDDHDGDHDGDGEGEHEGDGDEDEDDEEAIGVVASSAASPVVSETTSDHDNHHHGPAGAIHARNGRARPVARADPRMPHPHARHGHGEVVSATDGLEVDAAHAKVPHRAPGAVPPAAGRSWAPTAFRSESQRQAFIQEVAAALEGHGTARGRAGHDVAPPTSPNTSLSPPPTHDTSSSSSLRAHGPTTAIATVGAAADAAPPPLLAPVAKRASLGGASTPLAGSMHQLLAIDSRAPRHSVSSGGGRATAAVMPAAAPYAMASGGSGSRLPRHRVSRSVRRLSTAGRRKRFQTTVTMQLRIWLRFVWPLLLVALFYVAAWGYERATLANAFMFERHTLWFGYVRTALWQLAVDVMLAVADVPPAVVAATASGIATVALGGRGVGDASLTSLPSNFPTLQTAPFATANGSYAACNATHLASLFARYEGRSAVYAAAQDGLLYGGSAGWYSLTISLSWSSDGSAGSNSASSGTQVGSLGPVVITSQTALQASPTLTMLLLKSACSAPDMPYDCAAAVPSSPPWIGAAVATSWARYPLTLTGGAAAAAALPAPARAVVANGAPGFYNGVLDNGLHAAFRETLLLGRRTLQEAQLTLAQAASAGSGCARPDMRIGTSNLYLLDALTTSYLHPAFRNVQEVSLGLLVDGIYAFAGGHAALTAIAILLVLVVYWWVLRRSIRKMDGDMKRTRGTLLLFPTDVLAGVAHIMQGGLGMSLALHDDEGEDEGGAAGIPTSAAVGGAVRGRPALAL